MTILDARPTVPDDGVTVVDNSILTAMAMCPTLAALRYVLGLTLDEDRAPLLAGSMAHALLAEHLRGKDVAAVLMLEELVQYEAWARDSVDANDRLAGDNVRRVLARWFATHPLASLPVRVDPPLVEVGFAVPLDRDIVFVGRMDALVRDEAGVWYVWENKTSGRLDERWRRRFRTSAQITGYVWAAQQYLSEPVAGCFVNGIEFAKLPTDTKKCRVHSVPYTECGDLHARFDLVIEHRTPAQLEAWADAARRLARRYAGLLHTVTELEALAEVPMLGQFAGACVECQFANFCGTNRPVETARAIMRHEPWSPFERAFARDAST